MLHFLRQNKQCFGALVLTVLLMGWLTLTCQNCFADTGTDTEDVSLMHANMECCSEGGHSDHGHTAFDHKSCGSNYLMSQPVVVANVADNMVIQSGDPVIVLLPVSLDASSFSPPDNLQHAGLNQDVYFYTRLFSSYRILLI